MRKFAWLSAVMVVCLGSALALGQFPIPGAGKKLSVEEWQKLFPFKSLEERLAYEKREGEKFTPKLSKDADQRLAASEKPRWPWGNLRVESLKRLHSSEAAKFIAAEGNGITRMPSPSTRFLDLPAFPSMPVGQVSYAESKLDGEAETTLPKTGGLVEGEKRLPSLTSLMGQHQLNANLFLDPNMFGFVKDRKNVAGFESHQFRHATLVKNFFATAPLKENTEKWVLRRLELVSLLKEDRPAVYVSEELPRMDRLKNVNRRALTEFEGKALKSLNEGEDFAAESTTNRIRMVGSLRASKQCLECHDVERGTLLGAFSYELLRDPMLTTPAEK